MKRYNLREASEVICIEGKDGRYFKADHQCDQTGIVRRFAGDLSAGDKG